MTISHIFSVRRNFRREVINKDKQKTSKTFEANRWIWLASVPCAYEFYIGRISAKLTFLDVVVILKCSRFFSVEFYWKICQKKINKLIISGNITTCRSCKNLGWFGSLVEQLSVVKQTLWYPWRFFPVLFCFGGVPVEKSEKKPKIRCFWSFLPPRRPEKT